MPNIFYENDSFNISGKLNSSAITYDRIQTYLYILVYIDSIDIINRVFRNEM